MLYLSVPVPDAEPAVVARERDLAPGRVCAEESGLGQERGGELVASPSVQPPPPRIGIRFDSSVLTLVGRETVLGPEQAQQGLFPVPPENEKGSLKSRINEMKRNVYTV